MKFIKFTLIELLVVVAIIGILASIILPVLGNARDKAKQADCKNNLKSIGNSMRIYFSDDHDSSFPTAVVNTEMDASHGWVNAFEINLNFLDCKASRKDDNDTYWNTLETSVVDVKWNQIAVEYDLILIEDKTIHSKANTRNKMFVDGHVEAIKEQ